MLVLAPPATFYLILYSNYIHTCHPWYFFCIQVFRGDGVSRPSIFIDGGIHAREWIAPATVLFFISQVIIGLIC